MSLATTETSNAWDSYLSSDNPSGCCFAMIVSSSDCITERARRDSAPYKLVKLLGPTQAVCMIREQLRMRHRIRIRLHHIEKAYDELCANPSLNGQDKSFGLGAGIVRRFLGDEWVDHHFDPNGTKGFFTIDESSEISREIAAFRLIDLSETLFNLQNVTGFDECIERMRNGDIEGTFAELDFGRMLFLNEVPFRFVPPVGVKRFDYDIELIHLATDMRICADAKCKIHGSTFTKSGIRNALKKARGQLPKDKPSIVFIKVPSDWIADAYVTTSMFNVAREFLSSVRRIVSVVFYSAPLAHSDKVMMHQHAYKEVLNPTTDFGNNVDWRIFRRIRLTPEMNGMPHHWQRILFFPDGTPK
jgi:hypothetical protein